MAGGAGGRQPLALFLSKYLFYLNILFDGALVNISNFCSLYYISYIKKKTLKSVQGPYFACCLLVYFEVRETLNHAFRALFCIAARLHCAHG